MDKDVELPKERVNTFLREQHLNFIESYGKNPNGFEQTMAEYLRMSGVYWCLNATALMEAKIDKECPSLKKENLIEFVMSCFTPSGGFCPSPGHDPHVLYTLTAVQTLALLDSLHLLKEEDKQDKVASYLSSMQIKSGRYHGGFQGDIWGEVDLRFSMCVVSCLALLGRLDVIDSDAAVSFIQSCSNVLDGGFGSRPGSECHSAMVYCGVGTLSLLGRLDVVNVDSLGWWLSERQLPLSGGLNGRPEKLPDVCYSWWVLASLAILGRLHWIQRDPLIDFILASQDSETGGIADRPGDIPDPFHTNFGVAALSLLIHDWKGSPMTFDGDGDQRQQLFTCLKQLKSVNPVLCMPQEIIDKLGIKNQVLQV
jgi:geranylgeranyl transferase type-2 subunit beta